MVRLNSLANSSLEDSWNAFLEMQESKNNHLDVLKALDKKRKAGVTVAYAEQAQLSTLLAAHSEKVRAFSDKITHLKDCSPGHERLLLDRIQKLGEEKSN